MRNDRSDIILLYFSADQKNQFMKNINIYEDDFCFLYVFINLIKQVKIQSSQITSYFAHDLALTQFNEYFCYLLELLKFQREQSRIKYYNSKLMEKPQAVGSLWNVNSWHWEMKNYSVPAKKILEEKILALIFEVSPTLKITHKKVKFQKAECEINIRKGKQILVYDFELDIDVFGQHQDEDNSQGSYKIREILSDDLNDMVFQEIKATEKNKTGQLLKKWIKSNAKPKIIEIFKHLEEELMKVQGDPKKIEEDKIKREEMHHATKKAREEKGAQKERLLEQQRDKERKLKEQANIKNFEEAVKKQNGQ